MKKDKPLKPIITTGSDSKQLTPKRKQPPKQWRQLALKLQEALSKIQQHLNKFLIQNFSIVLDSTMDITKYHQKLTKTLEDLKTSNIQTLASIFKKVKSMIDPLVMIPQRSRSKSPELTKDNTILRLEQELRGKEEQLLVMSEEAVRLRAVVKGQLDRAEENRQKQNRMTELLYILRKKNIDIDRIYEENCETPGTSKKNSLSDMDGSYY